MASDMNLSTCPDNFETDQSMLIDEDHSKTPSEKLENSCLEGARSPDSVERMDDSESPKSLKIANLDEYEYGNHSQSGISDAEENSYNYNGDSLSPQHPRNVPITPVIENGVAKYYCHLCSYSGPSEAEFNDHLNSHFEHKCDQCDYTSRTEGRLKQHVQRFHGCQSSDNNKEAPASSNATSTPNSSVVTPKQVNTSSRAQSRQKVYRCKQCDFTATVKTDFWHHARVHIKEDKLLQCTECPFVTEYKHHLEYHLRNHYGSKPFKCSKCNYACVNKSMLNSHMKSHTNIYQYRCADCSYATKYCHSLKLHLRKYNHLPASIINLDGTIDHDTSALLIMKRSGPKGGKVKEEKSDAGVVAQPTPPPPPPTSTATRFRGPPGVVPFWPLASGIRAGPPAPPVLPLGTFFQGLMPPFIRHQLMHNVEKTEPSHNDSIKKDQFKPNYSKQIPIVPRTDMMNMFGLNFMGQMGAAPTNMPIWQNTEIMRQVNHSEQESRNSAEQLQVKLEKEDETPLDLRKSSCDDKHDRVNELSHLDQLGRKRSRKGKAFKIDALCLKLQEKADSEESEAGAKRRKSPSNDALPDKELRALLNEKSDDDNSAISLPSSVQHDSKSDDLEQNNNMPSMCSMETDLKNSPSAPKLPVINHTSSDNKELQTPPNEKRDDDDDDDVELDRYNCPYCDISFSNCVMYSVHMGYHGLSNPFKCSICGEETDDKVSFFLHMVRAPHL